MFDTIILLTGPAEHSTLSNVLSSHRPHLTIVPVFAAEDLAAVEQEWLRRARLIAFASTVIVPEHTLEQLGFGAYNFHPGPPQYPGWSPAHFALYDGAGEFGVTAHRMVARVDDGPIVDVETFPVPDNADVTGLEELAYRKLLQMFWRQAGVLATQSDPLVQRAVRWGNRRSSRRAYREMCDIPVTISKAELIRRMKIFGANHYGIAPTINLHGISFQAVGHDADLANA